MPLVLGVLAMLQEMCNNTVVPLVLRAGLAVIFVFHGLEKVKVENDWGASWATKAAEAQGQPVQSYVESRHTQLAVAWGELVGGIALGVGFLTRLAAVGIGLIMAGAIYFVHGPHGFALQDQGFEYNFAILVLCVTVFLTGAGALSVDRVFRLRRKSILGR
jgi:putative oxidoreductase